MAHGDLTVITDEWARPALPDFAWGGPVLALDLDDRSETFRRMIQAGFLTRDEARELAGLA